MDLTQPFQEILTNAIQFLPRLLVALIIFAATVPLSGLVARWAERAARDKTEDRETLRLLSRLARWTVIVLGTLAALDQVNFDVTGFVAGLGIAAFTIGFALQDIARNFVAGILLLVQQPFSIGEAIKVGDFEGKVLDISIRDTVISTWDGELVILPNADVYTSPIVNYSAQPFRRRTVRIGVGYGEDVGRAMSVFLGAIREIEGVLGEPAPTVQAEEMADSALVLAARFWVDQETHSLLDVHSASVTGIKEAAEREGIDLPYPTQTVRLEGALSDGPSDVEQQAQ
jgi:small-conductance mechanosensitive channel